MAGSQTKAPRVPRKAGTRSVPRAVRAQQMLDVAGDVFATRGYHAASMDEIAQRADISKPMLYAYFESKDGLYTAYVEQAASRLLAALDAVLDPRLDLERQLWASVLAFLGFVQDHRAGWAVLNRELAARGGRFAETVARTRTEITRRLAVLLAANLPDRDDREPERLAQIFVGAGESAANWWVEQPEESREQVAERLMRVCWHGLASAVENRPLG